MAFVKSSSPLTLRAYWTDLQQAFHLPTSVLNPNWGPQTGGQFTAEGEPFLRSGPFWSEELLLENARAGFQLWAKLGLATRNRKAATLKSFLSWAHTEGLIERNLADRINCPRVPVRIPHFLSVDEVTALLKSFDRTEELQNAREQVLILLLYGGGLRVSEACGLTWSKIDFDRGLLRILGKGQKERIVPLPKVCVRALLAIRAKDPNGGFVFGERVLNPRTAYAWVRRRGEIAGLLKQLHPHALRHSYATHLLSGGANLRTLQELLGHESLQATQKYTHLGIDQLARTMENSHPLGEKKTRTGS